MKDKLITKTYMSQNKLRFFLNWKSMHNLSCTVKAQSMHDSDRACILFQPVKMFEDQIYINYSQKQLSNIGLEA